MRENGEHVPLVVLFFHQMTRDFDPELRSCGTAVQPVATLTMNPSIDVASTVDRVVPEHKLRCTEPRFEPGGGGINVSRALQILGGRSLALYPAGGPPGVMLQHLLGHEKLEHRALPIDGWTRENVAILESETGHQYRLIMPGPRLREREWRSCLDCLEALQPRPAYVVASGSLPPGAPEDFYVRVARICSGVGARFVLDTSGDALRQAAERGNIFLLKPNLRELGQIAGSELADRKERIEAARSLVESGRCEVVVVSMSDEGAFLVSRAASLQLAAPRVELGSRVGAGDSMVAGIVLGLARGDSIEAAARLGVAAGTAAVITPGTELCRREDTEELFPRISARPL